MNLELHLTKSQYKRINDGKNITLKYDQLINNDKSIISQEFEGSQKL